MDKNKVLAKNTIILSIGQFAPKIISMIILPILTKAFSTEEYGTYDLIISFASLAIPLMTLLVQQAVFRFYIDEKSEETCKSYITSSIVFVIIISFCWFILASIFGIITNKYFSFIIIVFILYFSESIYDLLGQIARGKEQNIVFSAGVVIYSVINMILLIVTLQFNCINVNSAILIISLSYIIASIFLCYKIKIKKEFDIKKFSWTTIKKLLTYSIPIIPSSISLWIVNLSDRLLISSFLGTSYNGLYAAASKIPNLFGTAFNVFNLAWTELAARSIKERNSSKYYSELFDNLYSFLIGIMLILIALSPIIFDILIDNKFNEGYWQIPILFIGVLLSSFMSFYGGLYIALKKTKQVGISSLIGGILNVIINLATIKHWGLYAASVSTVVSFLAILMYRILEINKFIKIKYNYSKILIGIVFLAIVSINFYINTDISFIVNLIIMLIYNIFLNKFVNFIKKELISKIKK